MNNLNPKETHSDTNIDRIIDILGSIDDKSNLMTMFQEVLAGTRVNFSLGLFGGDGNISFDIDNFVLTNLSGSGENGEVIRASTQEVFEWFMELQNQN